MMRRSVAGLRSAAGRLVRNARSDVRLMLGRWRHRRGAAASVLVVDQLVPDPRLGAGYPRAHALVAELVEMGCQVAFYGTEATRDDVARMEPAFGGKVHFLPPHGASGLRRVLRAHGGSFDLLVISRPEPMTAYAAGGWRPAAGRRRPVVVYDAEAVLSPREARRRALFGGEPEAVSADAAAAAELAPARLADAVSAVGPADAAVIAAAIGKPTVILSHLAELRPATPGYATRGDLLFVGRMAGPRELSPNVDSVVWFATEVMPELDRLIGTGYRLHLVGLLAAPAIEALLSDRIIAHGMVDDLAAFYDRARLFVAPTRYAAGLPLKLVEALGQGIPCVATPLLADQMGAGIDALPTGGTAAAFATACARLYTDEPSWSGVRDAGLRHVGQHYSRAAFRASIEQLLALER